jgi:hypothetical protein
VTDGWFKGGTRRVRQAVLTLLVVAAGARLSWDLLAPVVPVLVSLAVVICVLWVALGGRILVFCTYAATEPRVTSATGFS